MKNVISFLFCFLVVSLSIIHDLEAKDKKNLSDGNIYSQIAKAKHVFGPVETEDGLKGKVIFFFYWCVHSKEGIYTTGRLWELQEKHKGEEKFAIIGSHTFKSSSTMQKHLLSCLAWYPVYENFEIPGEPCPNEDIPYAVIFDHNGKIVSKGNPDFLYSEVKNLIDAAPHPILGEVKVKFCTDQAKRLESGKSISGTLKTLEELSSKGGEKGDEAKKLIDAANKYINAREKRAMIMVDQKPSEALEELTKLSTMVTGMESHKDVKSKIAELKKDSSLKSFIKLKTKLVKALEKWRKGDGKSWSLVKKTQADIQKLSENKKTSLAVANEAKAYTGQLFIQK